MTCPVTCAVSCHARGSGDSPSIETLDMQNAMRKNVNIKYKASIILTFIHCSDKIILGAQVDVKKVAIIPRYN